MSASQPTAVFDACFAVVVGEEGGYDNTPADPGNWTGGARGSGVLKGTNWGISAAAYPTYNIQSLTKGQAQTIYFGDYWVPTSCPALPAPLALMVFDAAVNNGQERAREWLQAALGVAADGVIGPETLAALAAQTTTPAATQSVCAEFLARRIDFMGGLKTWQQFGLGWARRLAALPFKAASLASSAASIAALATLLCVGAAQPARAQAPITYSAPNVIAPTPNPTGALYAANYGVVCDGVSNNTVPLQNFLNAIGAAQSTPGNVGIIPAGKCLFSSTLTLPAFNYELRGVGMYSTNLVYTGASTTADLLYLDGTSATSTIGRARLTNFRLASTTVMTAGAALHIHDASRVSTDHIVLDGADGNGYLWNGIWLDQTDLQFVSNFELRAQNDCFLVSANGAGNPGVQYDLFAHDGKVAGCGHSGVHMAGGFDNAHFDTMELTNNAINVIIDNALNSGKNQEVLFGPSFVTDQALSGDDYYINDTSTNCTNYCNIAINGLVTASNNANGINVHAYPNGFVTIASPFIQANHLAGINVDDSSTLVTVAPETVIRANSTWGINCSTTNTNVIYGGTARGNTSGSYSANCTIQTH